MKQIIYTMPDGHVERVILNLRDRRDGETDEQFIARRQALDVPPGATNIIHAEQADLPDFEFRDAWEHSGGAVGINLTKAIAVQEAKINGAKRLKARELSERELAGENVAAEKAQLQAIDARAVRTAKDTTELKAAWPSGLDRI